LADTGGDVLDHPIIRALPDEARRCVETCGTRIQALPTETVGASGKVRFIVSGAVGVFHDTDSACVAMIGPGGLQGLEECFLDPIPEEYRVLLNAEWIEVPAVALADAMGRRWAERMFAYLAAGRLRLLAAEASCNARHPVSQRLARWLLRLHEAAGSPRRLEITQSLLSEMLGVQRTTVNAAVGCLHKGGFIKNTRGRITIADRESLLSASCRCGDGSGPTRTFSRLDGMTGHGTASGSANDRLPSDHLRRL
jgi:CRP-like cAMP-binding protein